MDGKLIALVPHVTSGAGPVTLNVDGLGAKALRSAPGVELAAGTLISGTPYVARYVNSASEWILFSFFGANPYNVPLGAGMPYFLPAAPNSSFAFPSGQPISRTTYAALFALMGTTYGAGDGSTTFNLPSSWRPVFGLPREHERSGRGGAHHVRWIRNYGHDAGRNRRGAERRARRRRNSIARACQFLERPRPRAWCERPDAFARGERPNSRAWRAAGRFASGQRWHDYELVGEQCRLHHGFRRGRDWHLNSGFRDRHRTPGSRDWCLSCQRCGRWWWGAQQHAANHDRELYYPGALTLPRAATRRNKNQIAFSLPPGVEMIIKGKPVPLIKS